MTAKSHEDFLRELTHVEDMDVTVVYDGYRNFRIAEDLGRFRYTEKGYVLFPKHCELCDGLHIGRINIKYLAR